MSSLFSGVNMNNLLLGVGGACEKGMNLCLDRIKFSVETEFGRLDPLFRVENRTDCDVANNARRGGLGVDVVWRIKGRRPPPHEDDCVGNLA